MTKKTKTAPTEKKASLETFFESRGTSFMFPNEVLLQAYAHKSLLRERIEIWHRQVEELESKGRLTDAGLDMIHEWEAKARRATALLQDIEGDEVFVYEGACVLRRNDWDSSNGQITHVAAVGFDNSRAAELHSMPGKDTWLLSLVNIDDQGGDNYETRRYPMGNCYTRAEALNASCEWIAFEKLPQTRWSNPELNDTMFPGAKAVLSLLRGTGGGTTHKKSKKSKKNKENLSSAVLPATLPSMPSPSRQMFIKGRDVLDKL